MPDDTTATMDNTSSSPVTSPEPRSLGSASPVATTPTEPTTPTTPEPSFLESLPEDLRSEKCLATVKDASDLAKQFVNAQRLIGAKTIEVPSFPIPNKDSTPEEWEKFWTAAGRPENIEGYNLPAEVTEGLQVDEAVMKGFKELFHKEGLTSKQFTAAVSKYAEYERAKAEAAQQAHTEGIRQGLLSLNKEWGDKYAANMAMANDAFDAIADEDTKALFAENPGLSNHPAVVKLFHKIGTAMSEDSLKGITSTGGGFNPGSKAEALIQLQSFESENKEIIFNVNYPDQRRRDSVLAQRAQMYKQIYGSKEK